MTDPNHFVQVKNDVWFGFMTWLANLSLYLIKWVSLRFHKRSRTYFIYSGSPSSASNIYQDSWIGKNKWFVSFCKPTKQVNFKRIRSQRNTSIIHKGFIQCTISTGKYTICTHLRWCTICYCCRRLAEDWSWLSWSIDLNWWLWSLLELHLLNHWQSLLQ